jgi:hypothetical protein
VSAGKQTSVDVEVGAVHTAIAQKEVNSVDDLVHRHQPPYGRALNVWVSVSGMQPLRAISDLEGSGNVSGSARSITNPIVLPPMWAAASLARAACLLVMKTL